MRVFPGLVLTTLCSLLAGPVFAQPSPNTGAEGLSFFEKQVRPLLSARCYKCHSDGAKKARGGLSLDSAAAVRKGGDNGPAVVPGRPEESLLVRAVRYHEGVPQMPPDGRLGEREVELLVEWVRRGAPYPGPAATTANSTGGIDLEAGRRFWSFQPLRVVPLPVVRDAGWPATRIDTFLLAALEQRGLPPSPPAQPATLLRRVSFDLTGLPPTPDEVTAYVSDPSPDAYPRLVERLLASPHYGERWGRHWLDLARYCDVAESWAECKGQAYLYRDWVVRAFNADVPFDRFVQLQLAADLLPDAAPADRAALGLLGRGPSYWKELKLAPEAIEAIVAEEWEERVHTVCSTFLGLTVACARCHDHKFDPITTEDYYAIAGVFASTRLADRSLLPADAAARVEAARRQVQQLQEELDRLAKGGSGATPRAAEVRQAIDRLRSGTPFFDSPDVPGVTEAALFVEPDGPQRTKLVYRPGEARDLAVHVRGNPARTGPVIPRRFLSVLSAGAPRPFRQGSGRLELAQAIVTDAEALTARVLVNRVWKHHFGRGLVETPSDFGAQGERPSHPELLDDLARRFVANGWSVKWLHREIVLSAAYRQASLGNPDGQAIDPDNRLLWRMNRRPLDAEAWRDAMLAVTGRLDRRGGGPSVDLGDPGNRRRTLYGTVKRRELNDFLRLHDVPDPATHSAARVPTLTPLQQLFTLNSPFVQARATDLARRLAAECPGDFGARVRRAYALLFGRAPTGEEMRLAAEYFRAGPGDGVWEEYAQALLGSNEFLFVD